mgnify:CR=1 FL=1|jgi:hypothetical protein
MHPLMLLSISAENLFDDVGRAIFEMSRVVRPAGRVVVGDEGVGPWLRSTDYGRMVVTNNLYGEQKHRLIRFLRRPAMSK